MIPKDLLKLRFIALKIADSIPNEKLSENLLNRLSGFVDEVERLCQEIIDNSGKGSVWADRKGFNAELVKSNVEQLKHLSSEFESLSKYIEKQYQDKTVARTISSLVDSLSSLSKSTGGGLKKLLPGGSEKFIEILQNSFTEVQTRIRACRTAIKRLQEKENASKKPKEEDPLMDFDFGPES